MTAEILIMNREAAVLAADSAATMDQRTFNTDKIFRLSENQPIGLMIYNSPDLLGVPIAQIAKTFRRKNKDRDFQSINDCIMAFLCFIEGEVIKKAGAVAFEMEASAFFNKILAMILSQHETVKQHGFLFTAEQTFIWLANNRRDTFFNEFDDLVRKCINDKKDVELYESRSNKAMTYRVNKALIGRVNEAFDNFTTDIKKQIETNGSPELNVEFSALIEFFVNREIATDCHTGMIFCGYGASDTFPSYQEIIVDGLTESGLRCWSHNTSNITYNENAVIMPFAQTSAIDPILLGMNDYNLDQAVNYFADFNEFIVNEYDDISFDPDEVANDYRQFLMYLRRNVLSSYIDSISIMPKEELAIIAEALIDLCSMTRKMKNMVRSVGGPTDVAIISKADGFIWKKRKHYFDKKLNLHFS